MSGRPTAVLDTSVIFASINLRDPHHAACRSMFEASAFDLVIPLLCVAEVSHLLTRDLGAEVEAQFIESLVPMAVEAPEGSDWPRIAQLVRQYVDFPLGAVDASIVALAERLGAGAIMTLDHRHFRAIRPSHVPAFTLLP